MINETFYSKHYENNLHYANQKRMTVYRDTDVPSKTAYSMTYNAYENEAMKLLNGNAFKLFRFLTRNSNEFSFAFSPAYVSKQTGMSVDSVHKALK